MIKLNLPVKKNKVTLIIILALIVVLIAGFFGFKKLLAKPTPVANTPLTEQDISFDPEGPYALLFPRRDGKAMVLNLKRTSSYDAIRYEVTYAGSDGVDRGVVGDIDTKEKKGEYNQEILFGTCSKNVCAYDQGVSNGTLTLHIKKAGGAYRMITQWHLQSPNADLGSLSSGDGHFMYKIDPKNQNLSLITFTISNDLTGAPKLTDGKSVLGKVYAINTPETKDLPSGAVSIELAGNPAGSEKIARFDEIKNQWVEFDTKISGSTLSAAAPSGGVFAVLSSVK